MRALERPDEWNELLQLTKLENWEYDLEILAKVQKLAKLFGGKSIMSKPRIPSKYKIVAVHDGKETEYDSIAETGRNIPVSHTSIDRYLKSGETTSNGYRFYMKVNEVEK